MHTVQRKAGALDTKEPTRNLKGVPEPSQGDLVRGVNHLLAPGRGGGVARPGASSYWHRGHQGRVRALAFLPESKLLASAGEDGKILLWGMDWSSLQRRACKIANRDLTQEEWDRILGPHYGVYSYRETCKELLKGE